MGTRLTDAQFFGEYLRTDLPGLEEIPTLAEKGDYAACRRLLAAFVRQMAQPDVYFSTLIENPNGETTQTTSSADDAVKNIMTPCGTPHDFGEGPIDWFLNPTYNGYPEWTWQLSRHMEWETMAQAYRKTGDDKYAEATARQLRSWIDQAQAPVPPCEGYETLCWRSLECGIRMSQRWPKVLHTFYNHPAFDDDLWVDFCKSVWEHGERLRRDHRTGNWLIMEMTGLLYIGLQYPCFKLAEEWYTYAETKLNEELFAQVYPDGFQFELSTDYQGAVLHSYGMMLRAQRAYGRPVHPEAARRIEAALLVYVYLMRPNGRVPDINDGWTVDAGYTIASYIDLCPENEVLQWAVSRQKEGTPPAELNHIFENGGLATLRTGWGEDDTWLYFDGGEFGAGHQHEDKLEVLLYADRKMNLVEMERYAYDDSKERQHCLSTAGHNTVQVDGMGQNRRKTYMWKGEIDKKADLQHHFTPEVDSLRAVYNEGYGPEQDKSVTHDRSVYFFKKMAGAMPFAVVVDRLTADAEHDYEVLWHLDAPRLLADGMHLQADTLHLLVPEAPMETAGLSICRGVQFPEMQGWKCNSFLQKDYRPVYAAQYWLHGKDIRWVTVLYPDGGESAVVTGVQASLDVNDTKFTLQMADGTKVELNENDLW
ncbi:MAG: alginate lyase family protein [Clostridia bacterium]|nr:alginate lyase family protein [Clostridia bacterium]